MTITTSQVRAAIDAARVKLARQQAAVDATNAHLVMFEEQLEQLQAGTTRPDRDPVTKPTRGK